MAIYHFSAKIISRANGSSALASAAYRSASRLHDERLGRDHDFTAKSGVIHSEVMAPEGVPEELGERESLWNAVEAAEKRKDAQLAREVEFAIPREVDKSRAIELARDFVAQEFVSNGMIADLNLHWDIGPDGQVKPHAHVMLTLRSVNERGFGAKVRDWNRTQLLEQWREAWADHANGRLEELGIQARIDHRSFKDQGIELEPQHKIGAAAARMAGEGLEADRLEEHRQIAQANGDRIIANPDIALDAITRTRATFTRRDLALFVHRHSDGLDQFQRVMNAVESTESLVRFGQDGRGEERFTSREMILVEERLFGHAERLAQSLDHSVPDRHTKAALEQAEEQGFVLSSEQRDALFHIVEGNDLSILVGYAGSGKSALLNMARQAWEASGYQVRGAALSGVAAENLESSSGIPSITIASLEHQWAQDRERLTSRDILVVDETGLVGSRQLERLLREAERQGAKVVLVGDPEQLQAIEAGAAFRSLTERQSHIEMREVRRQHEDWQRESTRQLAAGRTEEALEAYRDHHMVQVAQTREEARANLVADWAKERNGAPDKSWIILTHTNEEVGLLNSLVREKLRQEQVLGPDISIRVERGERDFAEGDRVMFLKNDRGIGVKNGSLGIVESVTTRHMSVRLDGGRSITFDLKDYAHLDYGYAATIHKAQGVTVDRVHILATPGLDRHATYVALSRHREQAVLHYGRDDFADDQRLARLLSRERAKDMASDYEQQPAGGATASTGPAQSSRLASDRAPEHGRERGARAAKSEHWIAGAKSAARDVAGRAKTVERRKPEIEAANEGIARRTDRVQSSTSAAGRPARDGREGGSGRSTPGKERLARQTAAANQPMAGRERATESDQDRDMSASFRPAARPPEQLTLPLPEQPDLGRPEAIRRYARALLAVERMQERRRPVLPQTRQDLDNVFGREPGLVGDAAAGRAKEVMRAIRAEADVRSSPAFRADRFIARWKDLEAHRLASYRSGDLRAERSIKAAMGAMANSLERDAQVDTILRNRQRELGIPIQMGRSVGQSIITYLGIGRGRELGR